MIEIPVRVKDALREGNRLKNYKFHIYPNGKLVEETATVPYDFYAPYDQVFYFTVDDVIYDPMDDWNYKVYDPDGTLIKTEPFPIAPLGPVIPWTKTYMTEPLTRGQYVTFDIPEEIGIHISINDYYDPDPLFTIENDNLVKETVKIDERMCSGDDLVFGLCEGSSLEFQYFDYENITGRRIKAEVEVQYKDTDRSLKWYTIPMGWFTVAETSRQASTGIMKVTAYNKLKSEYLDQNLDEQIKQYIDQGEIGYTGSISLYKLLNILLLEYSIEKYEERIASATVGFGSTATYTISASAWGSGSVITGYVYQQQIKYNGQAYEHGEYYKVRINIKNLFDQLCSELNYDTTYVSYQGQRTTLREYAKTYSGRQWGGVITFRNVNNIILYQQYLGLWLRDHPSEEVYECEYITNIHAIQFALPCGYDTYSPTIWNRIFEQGNVTIILLGLSPIEKMRVTVSQFANLQNITTRNLQSAVYEINCQYGKLDRVTDLFSGISLTDDSLFPSYTLYPNNSLYPQGGAERGNFSMYGKLWADEGNVHKFRYLFITYKGTETEGQTTTEVEKTMQFTINEDGTDDYYVNNNWLFKNLVWADEDVEDYGAGMVSAMQSITWFPFEMWCAGLPYIETGDQIEINMGIQAYKSYVLRRTLSGIQNLQDDLINGTLDIF